MTATMERQGAILAVSFGEWLYAKRKAARMSQDEVAERAGCSKNYISILERNAPHTATGVPPQPTRKIVIGLARALSAPVSEALDMAGYVPKENQVQTGIYTMGDEHNPPDSAPMTDSQRLRLEDMMAKLLQTVEDIQRRLPPLPADKE